MNKNEFEVDTDNKHKDIQLPKHCSQYIHNDYFNLIGLSRHH